MRIDLTSIKRRGPARKLKGHKFYVAFNAAVAEYAQLKTKKFREEGRLKATQSVSEANVIMYAAVRGDKLLNLLFKKHIRGGQNEKGQGNNNTVSSQSSSD